MEGEDNSNKSEGKEYVLGGSAAELERIEAMHESTVTYIGRLFSAPVDFRREKLRVLDSGTAGGMCSPVLTISPQLFPRCCTATTNRSPFIPPYFTVSLLARLQYICGVIGGRDKRLVRSTPPMQLTQVRPSLSVGSTSRRLGNTDHFSVQTIHSVIFLQNETLS